MQTPKRNDFSNLVFYGTSEALQDKREAETPHTETRIIQNHSQSDYCITTKHGPRKVLQIQEKVVELQLLSTETQFMYEWEIKTTIAYVNYGKTIQTIKNTNPHFTCADVERNVNNNFDYNNAEHEIYQCYNCKKLFSQISEYRKHLVEVVIHVCNSCGKSFQNYEKYVLHCLGHDDPDRRCSGCGKVLANKYSLKKHKSICKKILTRKLREFRKPPKTVSN